MRTSTAVFQSPSAEKPKPYSDGKRCGPTPGSCGRAPRSSKLSTPAVQPLAFIMLIIAASSLAAMNSESYLASSSSGATSYLAL